jgi:asparagine synthetase B (glutamine-hydrolysing)
VVKHILKLEPGKILNFEINCGRWLLTETRWSTIKFEDFSVLSVVKSLRNSVGKRIPSDVPLTALFSGGVDSTIVGALLDSSRNNTEVYFVDFDNPKFSEKKWADYLSKRNKMKLNTVKIVDRELIHAFDEYYSVFDEPFADYSGIPSMLVFKEVSKKYKVVLTGDGGDELFFGYPHYLKKYILPAIDSPLVLGLDNIDEIFLYPEITQQFSALLRAWHEKAKTEDIWQNLRLVIAHSQEVDISINLNQSPFNVGLSVEIGEFNLTQIKELVQKNNIKNIPEYKLFRTKNMPSNPNVWYKDKWVSWFDFLNTTRKKTFL